MLREKCNFCHLQKCIFFVVFLSFLCHFVENLSFFCRFGAIFSKIVKTIEKFFEKWQKNDRQNWNDKKKRQKNDKNMTKKMTDETEMTKKNDKKMTNKMTDKTEMTKKTTKKWQKKWQTKLKWQKTWQKNDKINIWTISRVWLRVSSKIRNPLCAHFWCARCARNMCTPTYALANEQLGFFDLHPSN